MKTELMIKMKKICIIGAGNIGSRHLQALKKISTPVSIEVVDPSVIALETAKERYNQIESIQNHQITFLQDIDKISNRFDLAIIATNSNIRRKITEKLLSKSSVKYLILEKILFQNKKDYAFIEKLLKNNVQKTWVNFSMRTIPFYFDLKKKLKGENVQLIVSGSNYGLVTNAVHYIDYLAYLTNCFDFTVDTTGLEKKIIESKRPGFLELTGTLNVYFKNGSSASMTCYPDGNAPYIIEILSKDYRCISKESEKKAFISESSKDWRWVEMNSNILYQSEMSNIVAESIFKSASCNLATYKEASKIHLTLLESLQKFINKTSTKKYTIYPFT